MTDLLNQHCWLNILFEHILSNRKKFNFVISVNSCITSLSRFSLILSELPWQFKINHKILKYDCSRNKICVSKHNIIHRAKNSVDNGSILSLFAFRITMQNDSSTKEQSLWSFRIYKYLFSGKFSGIIFNGIYDLDDID